MHASAAPENQRMETPCVSSLKGGGGQCSTSAPATFVRPVNTAPDQRVVTVEKVGREFQNRRPAPVGMKEAQYNANTHFKSTNSLNLDTNHAGVAATFDLSRSGGAPPTDMCSMTRSVQIDSSTVAAHRYTC